jgi:hypothetical protein
MCGVLRGNNLLPGVIAGRPADNGTIAIANFKLEVRRFKQLLLMYC